LKLDTDGNGVISKEEFYEGLKKVKLFSYKIDKIFNSMDSDKSGNI